MHRQFCKLLFLDLIVAEPAVDELKLVKAITDAHIGDKSAYRSQLARLIQFSPLPAIHWINIPHRVVTFITIVAASAYSSVSPGSEQRVETQLEPGQWYVGVESAMTVAACKDDVEQSFVYSGNTETPNGVSDQIRMTAD